jgi:hypothetical protein
LLGSLPLSDTVQRQISNAIGIPLSIFGYVINRTRFDDANAKAALAGSGIECPKLDTYADKLWSYWEMHLHHDYKVSRRATARLAGKVVVVTGASSGIGNALAKKLAIAGAKVVLVARTRERLEETRASISAMGGDATSFPCDLTDMEAIDECATRSSPSSAPSTSSSTTRGARFAARCGSHSSASTTSSARCSSTISARCA